MYLLFDKLLWRNGTFVGVSGVMILFVGWFGMGKERTKLGFRCWGLVTEIYYSVEITRILQKNH